MTQIDDSVSLQSLLELNSGTNLSRFERALNPPLLEKNQSQLPAFSFKYLIVIDDEL